MKKCQWKEDKGAAIKGFYDSKCGKRFLLLSSDTHVKDYKFCPYCGGKLIIKEGKK